ncbi:MAG: YegP family protein [Oscillospiraceae bacterium]|nr:YegP family protein [Oscillospiraceae bacterium]MBQ7012385.1 YegP family protein [Oscillospiraceae bacterium]
MGKFVIKQTKTGYTFALKAGNGETIAIGGEVYSSLDSCKNGCESVMKNAPEAALEDQTVEGYVTEKHPKFELYTDKAGEFRFRLKAKNGQIIAASEGYTAKASCKNGIESVRKNSVDAPVIEPEA